MAVYALSSVASGSGVYTGVFPGGSSNAYAGYFVAISGFANNANNGTFLVTASGATTLTTGNTASVAETKAATATDITHPICLDAGGYPETVVSAATATGTVASKIFSILSKQAGTRQLWLQAGTEAGTVSTFTCVVQQSFDGGVTWQALQSAIDLVGSPSQQVSPPPSPGASLRVAVATITGSGATVSVVASSN